MCVCVCVCVYRSAYLEVCELGCVCVAACMCVPAVCLPAGLCVSFCVCLQPGVLVCVLAQGVWILVGVAAVGAVVTFLSSEAAGRPGWDHRSQPPASCSGR